MTVGSVVMRCTSQLWRGAVVAITRRISDVDWARSSAWVRCNAALSDRSSSRIACAVQRGFEVVCANSHV